MRKWQRRNLVMNWHDTTDDEQPSLQSFTNTALKKEYQTTIPNTSFLENVRLASNGKELAEHCWMGNSESFKGMDLRQGDKLLFSAKVKQYKRCNGTKDFGLFLPTNIKKINPNVPTLDGFLDC